MFLQFKPINFSVRKVLLLLDPRYLKYRKLEQLLVKKASLVAQYNTKIYEFRTNSISQNNLQLANLPKFKILTPLSLLS